MFPKLLLIFIAISIREGQCVTSNSHPHPLDELSPEEFVATRAIIYTANPSLLDKNSNWVFNWITLNEPDKSLLLPYYLNDGVPPMSLIPRKAKVILLEKRRNIADKVIVNLNENKVESWIRFPDGTQVTFSVEDLVDGEQIARRDPRIIERCRQMGWANMSLVSAQVWSVSYTQDRQALREVVRPMMVFFYGAMFEGDNVLAHPFDFVAIVDLAMKRVAVIDNLPTHTGYDTSNREGNICPKWLANYEPSLKPANFLRRDLRPIRFSQPQGASYRIRGNEVSWQKFKFRIGFNKREAVVIHHVSYRDGPRTRPLFYRMSISELFVPYGDARPPYHQKFPFDMGQFTLGTNVTDHKLAGICRGGTVAYIDAYINDEAGNPDLLPNAFCIHEEDAGLLWAHDPGKMVHVRSQRLAVTFFANMGNYDYMFTWYFYQDASIQLQVQLHGILNTEMLAVNVTDPGEFGTIVGPQKNAQYHQHFFSVRLDPEIDGNLNSVSTLDVVGLPDPSGSPRNPYGQGFTTRRKVLRNPLEARTNNEPSSGRSWLFQNPSRLNPYNKHPVGYKLVPHHGTHPFVRKDSPLYSRTSWLDYDTWVLKYKEDQHFAAGLHPSGRTGLPIWANESANEDLTNTDVVVWYNFGYVHIPRTEDFPIMPTETLTINLKPANFFLENPALDVSPPSF